MDTGYRSPTSFESGAIEIKMPDKVAGTKYRITLANSSALIDAQPYFNTTCKIGLNLSYTGSSSAGLIRLKYIRYANGTDSIEMSDV